MICSTPKASQIFFVYCVQGNSFLQKNKKKLRKSGSERLNEKRKEVFITVLTTVIKKDPITSIRKHTYVLKVYEKTVRTSIKQDISRDLNPLITSYWLF